MPALVCPRCQRANPEVAAFCYFDGAELRARHDGAAAPNRLSQEFVFPSGRRCRTFDEFAQGCRDEWAPARDLLRQGMFKQYFGSMGRADLVKAASEAMAQTDADIALTTFLGVLPVSAHQAPKIDINPRRILLGNLLAGEHRHVQVIVTNQGQGTLQGTMTVTEGSDWLKIDGANPQQCAIATAREQKIALNVNTRGLPAGGTYGAKLTVITNGGAVEVLARMDLVAQPFTKPPFHGAKAPRDMAERMRRAPKAAVPMLESGEVSRWFTANGWNFPIRGPQAKGVAGVQQFFETMGLSKPPPVQVSQTEVRLACVYPETVRSQVAVQTGAKKWVYATVTSDCPWLRVLTPQVSGPQQATIAFEVDPKEGQGTPLEGKLHIAANGGQALGVKVHAEVRGAPQGKREPVRAAPPVAAARAPVIVGVPLASGGMLRSMLAMALAFLLVRLALVPIVDLGGRARVVAQAATKLGAAPAADSPLSTAGGSLQLPWGRILAGDDVGLPVAWFNPALTGELPAREFRHYFASYFLRYLTLWTWWLGAVLGATAVYRHAGGLANVPWGIVAGAVAGVAGSVTAGSAFLVLEIVPHVLWQVLFHEQGTGVGLAALWIVLAVVSWTCCGALAGLVLSPVGPLRRHVLMPVQRLVAGLCRLCGLRGLAMACGA